MPGKEEVSGEGNKMKNKIAQEVQMKLAKPTLGRCIKNLQNSYVGNLSKASNSTVI